MRRIEKTKLTSGYSLFAALTLTGFAVPQDLPDEAPRANCFCSITGCGGVRILRTNNCPPDAFCICEPLFHPDGCVIGLLAVCFTPGGGENDPKPNPGPQA